MQKCVLLSIKPEFAEAILSGLKRFEFRRSIFRHESAKRVFLYASNPTMQVVGEFTVRSILTGKPDVLWRRTRHAAGIQKSYYDAYFHGRDLAHAIEVGPTRRYRTPLQLMEHFLLKRPPQSFQYVAVPAHTG